MMTIIDYFAAYLFYATAFADSLFPVLNLKIWHKFVQETSKGWLSCKNAENSVQNASRG